MRIDKCSVGSLRVAEDRHDSVVHFVATHISNPAGWPKKPRCGDAFFFWRSAAELEHGRRCSQSFRPSTPAVGQGSYACDELIGDTRRKIGGTLLTILAEHLVTS